MDLFQHNDHQITELADRPYPYELFPGEKSIYQFQTDAGLTYFVSIVEIATSVVEIIFELVQDDKSMLGITGTGDSFRVFSTVADIVKNYISQYTPKQIQFGSDLKYPSRMKLYQRIAQRLDKELPEYSLDTTAAGSAADSFFILKRKTPSKSINESTNTDEFKEILKKFLPLAKKIVKLDKMPKIVLKKTISHGDQPTMGRFHNDSYTLELAIANRQPVDILRTLAHELVHAKQVSTGVNIDPSTGSNEENEANVVAGIVMRHFNKKYPEYLSYQPVAEGTNNGRKRICR